MRMDENPYRAPGSGADRSVLDMGADDVGRWTKQDTVMLVLLFFCFWPMGLLMLWSAKTGFFAYTGRKIALTIVALIPFVYLLHHLLGEIGSTR